MSDPTKFEFARPTTPRAINIDYISPPVCIVAYQYVPGSSGVADGVSEL